MARIYRINAGKNPRIYPVHFENGRFAFGSRFVTANALQHLTGFSTLF